MTTLYRLRDLIRVTGLSRSQLYRLEAAGDLPGRVRLGARASAWRADEIDAWIDARPRARDVDLERRSAA
jgi:prophage regulatory protein